MNGNRLTKGSNCKQLLIKNGSDKNKPLINKYFLLLCSFKNSFIFSKNKTLDKLKKI